MPKEINFIESGKTYFKLNINFADLDVGVLGGSETGECTDIAYYEITEKTIGMAMNKGVLQHYYTKWGQAWFIYGNKAIDILPKYNPNAEEFLNGDSGWFTTKEKAEKTLITSGWMKRILADQKRVINQKKKDFFSEVKKLGEYDMLRKRLSSRKK